MRRGNLAVFARALHLVETCDNAGKLLNLAKTFEREAVEG